MVRFRRPRMKMLGTLAREWRKTGRIYQWSIHWHARCRLRSLWQIRRFLRKRFIVLPNRLRSALTSIAQRLEFGLLSRVQRQISYLMWGKIMTDVTQRHYLGGYQPSSSHLSAGSDWLTNSIVLPMIRSYFMSARNPQRTAVQPIGLVIVDSVWQSSTND